MKFNIKAFALTCGILWSLSVFLLTWWIILFEGVTHEALFFGRFYFGYEVSPLGSVIGLVWAFFDGLIGGALFAWLYNVIVNRIAK